MSTIAAILDTARMITATSLSSVDYRRLSPGKTIITQRIYHLSILHGSTCGTDGNVPARGIAKGAYFLQ